MIKNSMPKILSMPKTVLNSFRSLLSRFNVFTQILVIISVMLVFLIIEGYLGYQMIGAMQQVTKKVFQNSTNNLTLVKNLEQEISQLEKGYLSQLANTGSIDTNVFTLRATATQLVKLDQSHAKAILDGLDETEELLKGSINQEQYKIFADKIYLMTINLQEIERQCMNSALDSMTFGNQFFVYSRNITLIILIISALISVILGLTIATSLSRPLRSMAKMAKALSSGDLSVTLEAEGSREVTEVVQGMNHAISSLRSLIGEIDHQSNFLLSASKELKIVSEDSGRSASEMSLTMDEMSKASLEQTSQITQTVDIVNQLGQFVRKVSADMDEIVRTSGIVSGSAEIGQKITGDVVTEISEVYSATKDVAGVIHEMNQTSGEISGIVSVIEGVAEQTTLLALNAAIEAARAGEHGKGFSVVARETGKLAEQSKQAAAMIGKLITKMKNRNNHAVEVIKIGMFRVESGKNLTEEARVAFADIFRALHDILGQIDNVAVHARNMAEKNETVINAITTIAAISEESMASTEEITAASEEQSASAENVKVSADNLAAVAERLKHAVSVFNMGGIVAER